MAYRFVLANPAVSTALVGTARIEELEAALAFADEGGLLAGVVSAIREIKVSDRSQLVPAHLAGRPGTMAGLAAIRPELE